MTDTQIPKTRQGFPWFRIGWLLLLIGTYYLAYSCVDLGHVFRYSFARFNYPFSVHALIAETWEDYSYMQATLQSVFSSSGIIYNSILFFLIVFWWRKPKIGLWFLLTGYVLLACIDFYADMVNNIAWAFRDYPAYRERVPDWLLNHVIHLL